MAETAGPVPAVTISHLGSRAPSPSALEESCVPCPWRALSANKQEIAKMFDRTSMRRVGSDGVLGGRSEGTSVQAAKERVLLVDDEPQILTALEDLLGDEKGKK